MIWLLLIKKICGNVAATNNKLVERYFNLNNRTKEKEDLFYAKEKC